MPSATRGPRCVVARRCAPPPPPLAIVRHRAPPYASCRSAGRDSNAQVDAPDASAGLYVRSRQGALVQPCIPSTHLGFQIGETAQILSGGLLQATPHAVKGANVAGVSRATFAIFMGPEFDFPMAVPDGIEPSCTQSTAAAAMLPKGVPPLASRWGSEECPFTTCKFADFATATFSKYH